MCCLGMMAMSSIDLRGMGSAAAASIIIQEHPVGSENYWDGLKLIRTRSWKPADQTRLANHYLALVPFANERPYQVLVGIMPVRRFVAALKQQVPVSVWDRQLLLYYAIPILRAAARTAVDAKSIEELIAQCTPTCIEGVGRCPGGAL